jgi:hypothetical protein
MPCPSRVSASCCAALFVVVGWLTETASAQTVWSGFTFSFTKPNGAYGTLPANQDSISPNVRLARGNTAGLYNAEYENGFDSGVSPDFTLWATHINNPEADIAAENYADLVFEPFTAAYQGQVGNTILGGNAVLYLTADNIYLDIQFTSWTNAHQIPSGGFSYLRAEPPVVAEPTGDYNGDGIVDAVDYTVWRNNLGDLTEDDINNSGDGENGVDPADYDVWKQNYGDTVPGAGSGGLAIPEPASIALLSIAMALAPLRRRKRG